MYEGPRQDRDLYPYRPFLWGVFVRHIFLSIVAIAVGTAAFFIMHATALDRGMRPLEIGPVGLFIQHCFFSGIMVGVIEFAIVWAQRIKFFEWMICSLISWPISVSILIAFLNNLRPLQVDLIHVIIGSVAGGVCLGLGQGLSFQRDRKIALMWTIAQALAYPIGFLGALFALFRN